MLRQLAASFDTYPIRNPTSEAGIFGPKKHHIYRCFFYSELYTRSRRREKARIVILFLRFPFAGPVCLLSGLRSHVSPSYRIQHSVFWAVLRNFRSSFAKDLFRRCKFAADAPLRKSERLLHYECWSNVLQLFSYSVRSSSQKPPLWSVAVVSSF